MLNEKKMKTNLEKLITKRFAAGPNKPSYINFHLSDFLYHEP